MVKITIIYGSVRSNRLGFRAALFLEKKLQERGVDVVVVDPKVHELPMLDKMYKEYKEGEAPTNMEWIAKALSSSDGFLVVTGEYNHSTPPALKNILDHFQTEYFFKPAGIASYSVGPFGGVRGALTLRTVLPELGMPTIPSMFPISSVHKSFDEEGNATDKAYDKRVVKFLDEFLWYVDALKHKREQETPY